MILVRHWYLLFHTYRYLWMVRSPMCIWTEWSAMSNRQTSTCLHRPYSKPSRSAPWFVISKMYDLANLFSLLLNSVDCRIKYLERKKRHMHVRCSIHWDWIISRNRMCWWFFGYIDTLTYSSLRIIGNNANDGISGDQRKRVTIGTLCSPLAMMLTRIFNRSWVSRQSLYTLPRWAHQWSWFLRRGMCFFFENLLSHVDF